MKKLVAFLLDSAPIGALAVIAFAGSFSHIRQTAVDHGQTGWMATAVAICIDLVCLTAARERQRDRRAGRKSGWPTAVLVGGVLLSLGANLDQAEHTTWGWIAAGAPCAAFVVAVSLLERRGAVAGDRRPHIERTATGPKKPVVVQEARVEPQRRAPKAVPSKPVVVYDDDVMGRARKVAEAYKEERGKPISRDQLKQRLGISTQRATLLRRELRAAGV